MPQLRDSGNHSSSPLDAGTLREVHSFARIFGIETEYGVSVTGADVPCDASQTAMMMFQPIIAPRDRPIRILKTGRDCILMSDRILNMPRPRPAIPWMLWPWMQLANW